MTHFHLYDFPLVYGRIYGRNVKFSSVVVNLLCCSESITSC